MKFDLAKFTHDHRLISNVDFWGGIVISTLFINLLGLLFPILIMQVYDRVMSYKIKSTLFAFLTIAIISLTLELILKILRGILASKNESKYLYRNINRSVTHLFTANYQDYLTKDPEQYLTYLNANESLCDVMSAGNLVVLCDVPFLLLYMLLLFCMQPIVACVLTISVGLIIAHCYYNAKQSMQKFFLRQDQALEKNKFFVDVLDGIYAVKALGLEEQMLRKYESIEEENIKYFYEYNQQQLNASANISTYGTLLIVITIISCVLVYIKMHITVGVISAIMVISGRFMQPISKLYYLINRVSKTKIAEEDAKKIFTIKPEILKTEQKQITNGKIIVKNVTFFHKNKLIFKDVNLEIAARSAIAIHGDNASGKTTLINLLAGLYMPTSGEIYIDDNDLANVNMDFYRSQISVISQNGAIFKGSVLDNITMFSEDKQELADSLVKKIKLLQSLHQLPNGLNTELVSANMGIVSRGDKQKILIARALVNNPKIIFFDEADAVLDFTSYRYLVEFLQICLHKYTLVLISKRSDIYRLADMHYKISKNGIISIGDRFA